MISYLPYSGVAQDKPACRLRLRLPNGSELEAEGDPEFVREARRQFLDGAGAGERSRDSPSSRPENGRGEPQEPRIEWAAIVEIRGNALQLRAKLPAGRAQRDACLLLLAASQRLLSQAKPTATQLAKWLRTSGYPVLRMDRALRDAVSQGEILSSGSRRSRRYELTGSGRIKATLLAEELSRLVQG